ncbi:translocation/assembly module TamB domain-containing protein [Marivita sp.]|uniref:translocation/assembly module TamB domain-containing protein n=1 Tax=Marivita sp. TaxID=2003365 RepID=UPI003F6C2E0F
MRFIATLLVLLWWPVVSFAQETDDDPGYLAGLLQDTLSGAGRDVRIRGFQGALSSEATIELIAISDADGEWFRAENVVLDWRRAALLRGTVDVTSFSAERVVVSRTPDAGPEVPNPEATQFSIPDLPVSIKIEEILVQSVQLGAPLLGEEAEFRITGAAELENGGANLQFNLDRIDGNQAQFALAASYDPSSRQLAVDLNAEEAEGGLAATLLGIPGEPALALTVQGDGQVDDFTANIALATDNEPRITGTVEILAPEDAGNWDVRVDINGDPTPLLTEETRDFFGTDIGLQARVIREASGRMELPQFDLTANTLSLTGSAVVSETGWLEALDAEGRITNPNDGPVVLPFGGGDTQVASVTFDAALNGDLTFDARLEDFTSPDATLDALTLSGRGQIDQQSFAQQDGQFELDLTWAAETLALTDPALAAAVGTDLSGAARVDYRSGQPIRVSGLEANGPDYGLNGTATWTSENDMPLSVDLRLLAEDITRFSDLAGRPLEGRVDVQVDGDLAPLSGMVDLAVDGTTLGLAIGQDVADRLLSGVGSARIDVRRDETGTTIRSARVVTPEISLEANGTITSQDTSVQFDGVLSNLDRVYPGEADGEAVLDGSVTLTGTTLRNLDLAADLSNQTQPVRLPFLGGLTLTNGTVDVTATGGPSGAWQADIAVRDLNSPQASATTLALAGNGDIAQSESGGLISAGGDLRVAGSALRLSDRRLADALGSNPTVTATFDWLQEAERLTLQAFAVNTGAIDATGSALVTQALTAPDAQFAVSLVAENLAPLSALAGQNVRGRAAIDVNGTYQDGGDFDVSARGQGTELGINNATVDQLLGGVTRFEFSASTQDGVLGQLSANIENPEITARVSGPLSNLQIDARLANVGLIAPDFQGALVVDGTVGQQSDGYVVDVDLQGPGGTTLAVGGRVANGGTANLSVNGSAPLGLANVFISPRRVNGRANMDLRVSGPLALSSLSGTITPEGAEFSAPTLGIILAPITGQVQLTNGAALLGIAAQGNNGGSIDVNGRLGLTSLDANITATLNRFGVRDPDLYDTSVDGNVSLSGPIGRNLLVSGDLRLNETEIQVPSSGVSALGDIPPMDHLGATRPVMRTLDRAGLTGSANAAVEETRGPSSTRLDLTLTAPGQVFVRGRGLDAELAGQLRLTGPTSDIIPQGGFELVRGRLDILNQRFVLDEGRIQMSGSFNPVLRFVAETDANGITVLVILDGPASSPDITFSSSPELPEDEVLAQLLFGRDLSNLSALQALELANAVATLAGRGGIGLLSRLRDGFGLDYLDVSQTEDGGTAVRAGKYISDNVYSDVVVESGGRTEINLNLDVTDEITARGSVDNNGNSSVGVFFERDY